MPLEYLFWGLMIAVFIFSLWWNWPKDRSTAGPFGIGIIQYLLLAILGWRVFGAALKG